MTKKHILLFIIKLALFYLPQALAENLARGENVKFPLTSINFFAASDKIDPDDTNDERCKNIQDVSFPKSDLPTAVDKKNLQGCQAYLYYYGIGVKTDYEKARKCALIEYEKETFGDPLGAHSILMMIYANGFGVRKNLNVATRLACFIDGAPLEIQGRLDHLSQMEKKETFDICDDITSTTMHVICANKEDAITDAKTKNEVNQITSRWTSKQQREFQNMLKVAKVFFSVSASNENNVPPDRTWGDESWAEDRHPEGQILRDFAMSLKALEAKQIPSFNLADFKKRDGNLNAIYKEIIHALKNNEQSGKTFIDPTIGDLNRITADGVRKTQRAWLRYRDAWIKFAAVRYPQVSAIAWKTWLTNQRIDDLKLLRSKIDSFEN